MNVEIYYDQKDSSTKIRLLEDIEIRGHHIESGFISDGASVPRYLWPICAPLEGNYLKPFLLHDYLYATHEVSREEADSILYDMLREAGMGLLKAQAIYRAVRLFGGSHYSTHSHSLLSG